MGPGGQYTDREDPGNEGHNHTQDCIDKSLKEVVSPPPALIRPCWVPCVWFGVPFG